MSENQRGSYPSVIDPKAPNSPLRVGLLIFCVLIGWIGFQLQRSISETRRTENEIRLLFQDLRLGMTFEEFETVCLAREIPRDWVWVNRDSGRVEVSTPFRLGAKNWVVYLEFQEGGMTSARVRTMDSNDEYPPGAPADIGPPMEASPWPLKQEIIPLLFAFLVLML